MNTRTHSTHVFMRYASRTNSKTQKNASINAPIEKQAFDTCVCVCVYVCMHTYIYMYTYTYSIYISDTDVNIYTCTNT
jgi:hypothetical protein